MNLPKFIIALLIGLVLNPCFTCAQGYAKKDYYLVDSLSYEDLSDNDQLILDSCLKQYHAAEHDSDRIKAIKGISLGIDHDDAIKYLYLNHKNITQLLKDEQSSELDIWYRMELTDVTSTLGYIYDGYGDIPRASAFYYKSLEMYEELAASSDLRVSLRGKAGKALNLNNIGFIFYQQGDIPRALEYFHGSLQIFEELDSKENAANSLNNLGTLYDQQGDATTALGLLQRSLEIRQGLDDKSGVAQSLNNMGAIYRRQGETDKALDHYEKCLAIVEDLDHKEWIAGSLNNIGGIYEDKGDTTKALEYFYNSLRLQEEVGNQEGISISLRNIGKMHLALGQLEQAEYNCEQGLELARELGSPFLISHNAQVLARIGKAQGNFQNALQMYELHIQMRDSIKNEATQKATIRQQTKYEFERAQLVKEQEEKESARLIAEETSRRDNLQYSIIFLGLLVLGSLVLGLGKLSVSTRAAEGLIFFSFLILFEFVLVLADPYIETWSSGAPGIKLLFNAGIAALIFPLHSLFETKLKKRLGR